MKTHKAQLYDKIHSVIDNYNDRMVRGIFEYNFVINTAALGHVLKNFCTSSPIMHSAFHKGIIAHSWKECYFTLNDILQIKYTENTTEEAYRFITNVLPMTGNIQLKLGVFIGGGKSVLAIITNHMLMDGGDLKYFMKALCSAYNACVNGEDFSGLLKSGSRSYKTVYSDLGKPIKRKAKLLFSNPTPKNSKVFVLSAQGDSDRTFIVTRNISSEKFALIKAYGKNHGATINDMILTAYFMSLYENCGFDEKDSVTVSGAIDLRRYMKNSELTGLTNHSSYLPYTLHGIGKDFVSTLKKVTDISDSFRENPFTGLYGLPLLNLGYITFPAFISDRLVKRFYNNPFIAMSNIGILHEDFYKLNGHSPVSAFLTGTVKYKPSIMVSLTTYRNVITLSMCCKGNTADQARLEDFLKLIEDTLTDAVNT